MEKDLTAQSVPFESDASHMLHLWDTCAWLPMPLFMVHMETFRTVEMWCYFHPGQFFTTLPLWCAEVRFEVIMVTSMRMKWQPSSLVSSRQNHLYDGGSMHVWNVGLLLWDSVVPYFCENLKCHLVWRWLSSRMLCHLWSIGQFLPG
jgi:hypothetical protein